MTKEEIILWQTTFDDACDSIYASEYKRLVNTYEDESQAHTDAFNAARSRARILADAEVVKLSQKKKES